MRQFTIVYRDHLGVKFAFINADSADNAIAQVVRIIPNVRILLVRNNIPALETIAEVKS